ncbi:MAG: PilZ domain-containing protein [Desulfobacterales bacterium]|nr:PilZ domain-containing protein [Desulfobacterales bacterium]MBF0396271.1 PilZ domain-containing protein [Desulfobacterales bacterium]
MSDGPKKIYIKDNKATFTCEKCGKIKIADVSGYMGVKNTITVKCKCPCGNSYSVILERRKNYRKSTNIPGLYLKETHLDGEYTTDQGKEKGRIIVLDISSTGLRFKLHVNRKFHLGDKLLVEFNLDDKKRTLIKKEVIVKRIETLDIGAEFCPSDPNDHYTKAISWYLKI